MIFPLNVEILSGTPNPLAEAIAAARTCYASRGIVSPEEVTLSGEDRRIAQQIFEAGHHTTLQHANFTFAIDGISRLAVWSFLHAHPFYNSEQVSQRYVRVDPKGFTSPPLTPAGIREARILFARQAETYEEMTDLLLPGVEEAYRHRFPGRSSREKSTRLTLKRKAREVARYVLPLATLTRLHHTVSLLTLLRYIRTSSLSSAPKEQMALVALLRDVLMQWAPSLKLLFDAVEPLSIQTPILEASDPDAFRKAFDADLEPYEFSRLLTVTPQTPVLTHALCTIAATPCTLDNGDRLLKALLDPTHNPRLGESLNLATHDPISRAMHAVSYLFAKRLSHTADSQEQRHRMTPSAQPLLTAHLSDSVDIHIPHLIQGNPGALDLYRRVMDETWELITKLRKSGEDPEGLLYLLPNGVRVRYLQSAPLMHLLHKAKMRLCYNAQEEIWRVMLEEVKQVESLDPVIGRALRPPCDLRFQAGIKPTCPEGSHYCGEKVWTIVLDDYEREI